VSNQKTKPIFVLRVLTLLFCLISLSCLPQENDSEPRADAAIRTEKVLIVYLSRTNNTKVIAEIIHENVGGTLVGLMLEIPYPENYRAIVDQVAKENETGFLPPLKTKIDSIQKYDIVFIGFPTWGMQLPPPIKSFLRQYDLSGKTVAPFNTNGGYGIGSTFDTVKELCPNSKVLEGFSIKGGVERDGIHFVMEGEKQKQAKLDVKAWLERVKIIN
jgi:flavodoxin